MKNNYFFAVLFTLTAFVFNGQTYFWQQLSSPPNGSVMTMTTISNNLFAGCNNGGLYLSVDSGATWTQRNGNYPGLCVLSIATDNNDIYVGTGPVFGGGVYKTINFGVTWTNITPTAMLNKMVYSLLILNNNLYAGNYGGNYSSDGVYKSSLAGINPGSWSTFNTGFASVLADQNIRALTFNGANILAGTRGASIKASNANTANWGSSSAGLNPTGFIQVIKVNGSDVYAADGFGGLFKSTNGGSTWNQIASSVFNNSNPIYALIINAGIIYAGTEGGGAYWSSDGGTNWTAFNTGFLPCALNIRSLHFMGSTLFAGTDCGVWKTKMNITAGINEIVNNHKLQLYPNPNEGEFTITGANLSLKPSIEIYDNIGKLMYSVRIDSEKQAIRTDLAQGIYFVKLIEDGNIASVQKLIRD